MKFLLMIIDNEAAHAKLPPKEMERIMGEHGRFAEALQGAKKLVEGNRLRSGSQATTLKQRGGKRVTVDGPFTETKEALGGYYLIDVASKAEALEWAGRVPLFDGDAVEVRELWEM